MRVPAAGAAGLIGVLLGQKLADLGLEAASAAATAYAKPAFELLMAASWAAIGGLAFSRWLRFPPAHVSTAELAINGGARGAGAGVCALAAAALSWVLLGLEGPGHRWPGPPQDLWSWVVPFAEIGLAGFFLGALFAVIVGRGT